MSYAQKEVRTQARPALLVKAAAVLEDLEGREKAPEIESRMNRGFMRPRNRPDPA